MSFLLFHVSIELSVHNLLQLLIVMILNVLHESHCFFFSFVLLRICPLYIRSYIPTYLPNINQTLHTQSPYAKRIQQFEDPRVNRASIHLHVTLPNHTPPLTQCYGLVIPSDLIYSTLIVSEVHFIMHHYTSQCSGSKSNTRIGSQSCTKGTATM